MTKTVAYCILLVALGVVIVLSAAAPNVISDHNKFLAEFVTTEILNVLGVILAITLASAGQLHLSFNAIEERFGHVGLVKTRAGVHHASYCLIWLFVAAVVVVVVKPLMPSLAWLQAAFNGAALFILLWNVLILVSLTQAIFSIKAETKPR